MEEIKTKITAETEWRKWCKKNNVQWNESFPIEMITLPALPTSMQRLYDEAYQLIKSCAGVSAEFLGPIRNDRDPCDGIQ